MPITEQTSAGDTTRTIKAALRKAFPGATFSVTRGGRISAGPTTGRTLNRSRTC